MRWTLVSLALLASAPAVAGPGPAFCRPAELVPGELVTFEMSGLSQGDRATLFFGELGAGPCRQGVCLELDPPQTLAQATADGAGVARFDLTLPMGPGVVGLGTWLQAAAITGAGVVTTDPVRGVLGAPPVTGVDVCGPAEVIGCMDAAADNHDPSATRDDGSCAYPLTFELDLTGYPGGFTTPYVTGTFDGWCGTCNPLSDPDADGIWQGTVSLPPGEHEFKYTLDGWGVAESFAGGEPCTATAFGFTNRVVTQGVAAQTLLPVTWEACPTGTADVTFQLDDRCGPRPLDGAQPSVAGDPLNGWCGNCDLLSDPDADDIWSGTTGVPAGPVEFKFTVDGWNEPETLEDGSSCTLTTGIYINRRIVVGGDLVLEPAPLDGCGACLDVVDEPFDAFDDRRWRRADHYLGNTQLDPANAVVANGVCDLLIEDRGGWFGAEVLTRQQHGPSRWTARIAGPSDPGSVCAFFTYDAFVDSSPDGWGSNEIDVEILNGTVLVGTYADWHPSDGFADGAFSTVDPGRVSREVSLWTPPQGFDLTEFHDYTMEWSTDAVRFWVDGELIDTIEEAVPLDDMTVRFNHWTTFTWPDVMGPPQVSPLHCTIDHVRGESIR